MHCKIEETGQGCSEKGQFFEAEIDFYKFDSAKEK